MYGLKSIGRDRNFSPREIATYRLDKPCAELTALGRRHHKRHFESRASLGQAASQAITLAQIRQFPPPQRTKDLCRREQVGESLAGMSDFGATIDDRTSAQ